MSRINKEYYQNSNIPSCGNCNSSFIGIDGDILYCLESDLTHSSTKVDPDNKCMNWQRRESWDAGASVKGRVTKGFQKNTFKSCIKCNSNNLTYDAFWKEYTCNVCGWQTK